MAFYADDILVLGGPESFNELPVMILQMTDMIRKTKVCWYISPDIEQQETII